MSEVHEAARVVRSEGSFTLVINHPGALRRMFLPPTEINLGEAFIFGDFDIEELDDLLENTNNPFYRPPWRRLKDRVELMRRGYDFSRKEVVSRVVGKAFLQIRSWLRPLLQLVGHLSFYLSVLSFRDQARELGLEVSMATVGEDHTLELEGLFNPLLFRQGRPRRVLQGRVNRGRRAGCPQRTVRAAHH